MIWADFAIDASESNPRVRHRDIADIRLDGAERIVGRLRRRGSGKRIKRVSICRHSAIRQFHTRDPMTSATFRILFGPVSAVGLFVVETLGLPSPDEPCSGNLNPHPSARKLGVVRDDIA